MGGGGVCTSPKYFAYVSTGAPTPVFLTGVSVSKQMCCHRNSNKKKKCFISRYM